ncbi:MAG: GNAT family N-acetyltransferase [archaeon]|nr:GNAT family N-acetyltransferase [archaeon]
MHILTHDELPDSFDSEVQLLQLGAGWGIFDFDQIKRARKMGYPSSDYFAVYAVEDDRPVAKVEVIHIEFETPKGPEIMSGIAGVVTRRDKSRLGLAKQLLLEVHEREKASGIKYSLLWTGRNNKAHNLYESLGYVDIYDPSIALLKTQGNRTNSKDLTIRTATTNDEELMDNLHRKIVSKHLGFRQRPKNFMKILFDLEFEKSDSFRIFIHENTPVGYAYFQQNTGWIKSYEVIIEREYVEAALSLLETEAKGSWLAFANSFVSSARTLLTKRGYVFSDYTYGTLMVCSLDQASKQENMDVLLGANDPRFVCHGLDHF